MRDEDKSKEQLIKELIYLRLEIEKIRASETDPGALQNRNRMLAVLSGSIARYLEFPFAEVDYQLIADQLLKLSGAAVVLVHSYDTYAGCTVTEAMAGPGNLITKGIEFLGFNPVGKRWRVSEQLKEHHSSGKITKIDGVYALAFGQIPRWICRQIEKLFNLGDIYGIGLVHRGEVLGNIVIIMPAGQQLTEPETFQIFASIVATTILRKKTEKALLDSQERYRRLVEYSRDAVFVATPDNRYIDVNPAACQMLGYTRDELLRMGIPDLIPFKISDMPLYDKLVKQGFLYSEVTLRSKDGRLIPAEINYTVLPDGNYLGTVRDITQRKQAEKALRDSERFLSSIFESIQDRLFIIDYEFNIILTNAQVEQTYSHALPLIGKNCYRAFHGFDDVCPGCPSIITIREGKTARAVLPTRNPGGEVTGWLDHYCYPFVDMTTGQTKGVIVYTRDITEKLKIEQEMARLERLNLVGEMAASIGHEVRNPMTTVRGFLQMLGGKREYLKDREYFDLMIEELDKANSIITSFLSLARNKPLDLEKQNLNAILKSISPLISADAMNSGMNAVIKYGDIPDLLLNEKEIRQLILNIVRNGLEAMDEGGTLTIKTDTEGGEVVLSVQDRGKGIKPDLIEKIGTPFFTTKDQGTGLGLAVCYGIAARHNASIKVETGPSGTTFLIRFKTIQEKGEG